MTLTELHTSVVCTACFTESAGCTGTSARPDANNTLPVASVRPKQVDTNKVQLDSDDDDEDIWTQAAAAAKQRGNAMFQRAEHQHAVQLYTVSGHMDFQPALQRLQVLSMQCHVFTQLCTT